MGIEALALVILFLFLVLYGIKRYANNVTICKSKETLAGKIVLITGGNSGIGRMTATDLARRGGKVYIASEVPKEVGERAAAEIRRDSGSETVYFRSLDLASMKSVRTFAENFLKEENQLHVLINNAGLHVYKQRITEDGFDGTFSINYLGHFLLTMLLLGAIKKSAAPRILFTTSLTYRFGQLDFDDMMFKHHSYSHTAAYYRSKLAIVMLTRELDKRLRSDGVTVCAVSPGLVDTPMVTQTIPFLMKIFVVLMVKLIFVPPKLGAQTHIHCAVSREVEGVSGYYSNCKKSNPSTKALDEEECSRLWNYSAKLVGID